MGAQGSRKIDKLMLGWAVVVLLGMGALLYFGHTTPWGAELLNGFGLLVLLWGFLSPLYVLIRMGIAALQRRKATRLGLTYPQYMAQRWAQRHPQSSTASTLRRPSHLQQSVQRLLRIAPWELATASALLLLFGLLTERWRHAPGEHVGVTGMGMLYAFALYTLLGLQILHRAWASWHHRFAPGSLPPQQQVVTDLSPTQKTWNTTFLVALCFAAVELALAGEGEFLVVLILFIAPAIAIVLLYTLWRAFRHLLPHRHIEHV